MYLDIVLAFVWGISMYILWKHVSEKIPDLTLIPDQHLSVLLEENTAKLQRFFLHIFHFRSFYRERHYHDWFWSIMTKLLLKVHIGLLRLDNSIMRLMKRMRMGNEMDIEQRHQASEYIRQSKSISSLSMREKIKHVSEVRTQRRTNIADALSGKKFNESR